MKGRKPKPLAIRALEGNPGHRPLPKSPAPPVKLPAAPAHLSAAAKRLWKRIGPKFASMGVVAEVDEMAFAMLCESYAAWCELVKLARADGPVVRVNGQPVPNPYAVRADREAEKVRKLLAEFGGSPSSRSRLTAGGKASTPADELASFLNLSK